MKPTTHPSLGELADPSKFDTPIALGGVDRQLLIKQLRQMLVIRFAEEQLAQKIVEGVVHCPCHLGIGQEAIAVGVSSQLTTSDKLFGGHRSHSHYLAQGGSLLGLFAEVLGREDGCSKGMGGSMHLYDEKNGFIGSVPIVAATVPLAVGAALATKKDGKGAVAVAYFGDGAAEEGCVHEAMNFAAAFQLPVLFVCENNLFSSHLHIGLRQPSDSVARFAAAHCIPYETVDGNDVVAVAKASESLIGLGRRGNGPAFLEAVTYRWRGHVGPSEDIDVGVKRNVELTKWKRRDPVRRLVDSLIREGALTEAGFAQLSSDVRTEIQQTWEKAEASPFPPLSNTLSMVYAPKSSRTGGEDSPSSSLRSENESNQFEPEIRV